MRCGFVLTRPDEIVVKPSSLTKENERARGGAAPGRSTRGSSICAHTDNICIADTRTHGIRLARTVDTRRQQLKAGSLRTTWAGLAAANARERGGDDSDEYEYDNDDLGGDERRGARGD